MAGLSAIGYTLALWGISSISSIGSPPIESQGDLEYALVKRARLLGVEDLGITAIYSEDPDAISHVEKTGEDGYELLLSPLGHNLSTLDHELFHIADGHTDTAEEMPSWLYFFRYLFYDEPQAVWYGLTAPDQYPLP